MTDAYIYDAVRSPRGKGRPDGALHELTSVALSARILDAIKDRNGLSGHAVEDVIWGNVTQVGEQGGCLARSAVLASGLDEIIPGLAINRFCASGMEAVNLAANQVKGGAGHAYIAGGVEMMGRVAMGSDGAAIAVDPSLAMKTCDFSGPSRPASCACTKMTPNMISAGQPISPVTAAQPTNGGMAPAAPPLCRPGAGTGPGPRPGAASAQPGPGAQRPADRERGGRLDAVDGQCDVQFFRPHVVRHAVVGIRR